MRRLPPREQRLSIEERAERRRWVLSRGHDRFTALLRVLQGGRQLPVQRRRRLEDVDWEQLRWTAVKAAVALALLAAVGLFLHSIWRDLKVDTWSGPDATVQSGQRLRDCPVVNQLPSDDALPAWLRFEGAIYRRGRTLRGVADPSLGGTGYPETGHSLGSIRLLLDRDDRRRVLLIVPPARAAVAYELTPECA